METIVFGPLIKKYKVEEDFRLEMLNRGKSTNKDWREHLAGHIDVENQFTKKEDIIFFSKGITPLLTDYVEHFNRDYKDWANVSRSDTKHSWKNKQNLKDVLKIEQLWINFMKAGDFNPPHFHNQDLSFVLFVDVPKEITIENENAPYNDYGPGCLIFSYGEHEEKYITTRGFLPSNGDLFIFPAPLKHLVSPFKSDVTRITIAGNVSWSLQ
ncbi:putative 2OG-Fe(II) oxygenase family protein [Pelagibacter phage Mosig EXVC030M]|nr:putative 2OG-Fe(II) oxygenase family protein [Pelagibacter phage Mosig EXVC030M]